MLIRSVGPPDPVVARVGSEVAALAVPVAARVSPEATIISARSPTTFDDGVTLTMSPNRRFTSA